jgi:hypothetical protein
MQITSSSIIRLALAMLVALAISAPAADATTRVYMSTWESGGTGGVRMWTVGDASTTLLTTTASGSNYAAMAVGVDSTQGLVYWAGQNSSQQGYIGRAAAISGLGATTIWTTANAGYSTDLIIDGAAQLAYWGSADGGVPAVSVGSLTGSALTATGGTPSAVASPILALNSANSYLYWTNSETANPGTNRALAPLLPSRIPFTNAKAENNNMQSMVSNRAGTTMYSAICATRSTLATNASCTGDVYSKSISASATVAPTTTSQSITGLSALAVNSDDCVYYGTAEGVIGTLNLNGCTAAVLLTLPATTRISSLWIVESPTTTADPSISGGSTTGSTLTCNDASWNTDISGARLSRLPDATRNYLWFRNGTVILGTGGSTYLATEPGSYTCTVSASNVAGPATSAPSAAFTVATPAATPTNTTAAAATTTKTYPKITITWKLKGTKLAGTFKPVTNAKTYSLVGSGATKKSGTCKTSGSGTKKKVTCKLTLKKGTTTVTVTAKSKSKEILAQTVTSKSTRRVSVIARR